MVGGLTTCAFRSYFGEDLPDARSIPYARDRVDIARDGRVVTGHPGHSVPYAAQVERTYLVDCCTCFSDSTCNREVAA